MYNNILYHSPYSFSKLLSAVYFSSTLAYDLYLVKSTHFILEVGLDHSSENTGQKA